MSATAAILASLRRVHARLWLDTTLIGVVLAIALALPAWRIGGTWPALLVALVVLTLAVIVGFRRVRRHGRDWLVSRLDAERRDLDDSTALLFADEAGLGPLQRLQRARIAQRLEARPAPDLRPAWSRRWIVGASMALLAGAIALVAWPQGETRGSPLVSRDDGPAPAPGEPALLSQLLRTTPPAYTGIAASSGESLDAKVPVGTSLQWTLRYAPQPQGVELVFHDGTRVAMRREGEDWIVDMPLRESTLYRVVPAGVTGAESSKLHRLDAVPDQPPRVRVLAPERSLTQMAPGQREWRLLFEVSDDHGVAGNARLQVTRTEGTGENIRFHDHVLTLRGNGDRRTKRFEARLVPSTYGLQRGEDLVARLEVMDNRAPQPQQVRSASVILRWPPEPVVGAEGLEMMAKQVLPAYFRSQRQIIIDAEALLKERPKLAQDEFERRSDGIGVDQRLLRLRYGQFLGEEAEGGRGAPANDLPTNEVQDDDHAHEDGEKHEPAQASAQDPHDHDHEAGEASGASEGFGRDDGVMEAFGHIHDIPEAATLLDPKTREILRSALREMWQSELHLRQAAPQQALPYANRALELIKQVQQADRIYLQRVGAKLPEIDESRRMTGKRDGIASRALPKLGSIPDDQVLASAWRSLDGDGEHAMPALDALQAWADAHRDQVEDPLAWIARIDELRADPTCDECRAALRMLVWGALRRPPGGISRRNGDDEAGRRYLQLLQGEDER